MKRLYLLATFLLAGFTLSSFAEAKTDTLYFEFERSFSTARIDYRFSNVVLNGGILIEYGYNDGKAYRISPIWSGSITPDSDSGYVRIYYTNSSQTEYTAQFMYDEPDYSKDIEIALHDCSLKSLDVHNCSLLSTLDCNTYLPSLDVSGCTALTTLDCHGRGLTTLNVSGCTALTSLNCSQNQRMTTLDVSGCTALTSLNCEGYHDGTGYWGVLATLNVSGCTALTYLDCSGNQLTSLDVSGCSALTGLYCRDNQLTSLNASGCSSLTSLSSGTYGEIRGNDLLTNLNLSGCSAMKYLTCNNLRLTALDVSGCSALTSLDCGGNQLTTLDVSDCSALTSLSCNNNQLMTLDVSGCSALTTLNCTNNQLTSLNASGCSTLTTINFTGNNSLTSLNVSGCSALTSLSCNNNQLTTLDVSGCSALTTLNCTNNQLTSLNASGCSVLTTFDFSGNNLLTNLNVSGCSSLTDLFCPDNQLATLDVSDCSALTRLRCSNNRLTSLDVSGCTTLTELNCSNNRLTSLDVNGCTTLTELNCSNNRLTALDVSGFSALESLDCSDNQLTALDISGFSALERLDCADNQLTELDVIGCSALERLDCYNNHLTSLNASGCSLLTTFDFSGNNLLTNLNVSGCSSLTNLFCPDNQLATLDVSDCSALTWLRCYNNQLTSLSVNGCSALTTLNCSNNRLTSLDVSGCTTLTELNCSNNRLTALDVSGFSALESLDCSDNQLTALDVSGFSALERLDCADNQLTELDVIGCSALERLDCYNNHLTNLDVIGCSALTWLWCYDNRIPLSTLYNIYQSSDWTWFRADPQSDSISLLVGQALDLSSEGNLGGNTTDVRLYLDDKYCPEDYYTENNFTFLFYRPNEYRLELRNYSATSLQFDYYLSVKLPDGYFGIYVATGSSDMGSAAISGNGSYQEGSEVTITATPVSGYRFVNWTRENGEVFSTEAEYTFTATENLELTANFEENTFTLTLYANNPEWGSVWGCTWGDYGTYREGEEETIYASPSYHCHFVNWTKADGSVFSTEEECTFTITEDLELTANFEQDPTFTLTIHVNNSEWGYTYGANGTYYEGEEVTIYASPSYHCHFVNWTKADGSVFSTEAECTFTVTEDLELTANFEQNPTFSLIIHVNNPEWGEAYGSNGTYYEGEEVTIYASPNYGYHFVNWTKADGSVFSTEEECTFIVTEDLELTANFEQAPTFTVTLHVNNPEWGYTDECNGTYYEGDEVRIYAYPNYGYHFVNWTKADGSVFSTQSEYTFMLTESLELTANFAPDGGVGNENHGNDRFVVYVQDRTIYLSENVGALQVYNVTGQCVYSGVATAIPVRHSGVYIVKVGTRSYKIIIK